ncbi:hypothetical protein [Marinomonas profundi]|nr:hypothetical protein [Marinomonas profundi]
MNYLKAIIASLVLISTLAQADDSALNKAKGGAVELWGKTKATTIEIANSTSEKASEVGKKAAEFGRKASENTKETSAIVWDKMKEAGAATADSAKKGASKIRNLAGQEDCKEDSALCYKDKK